jgi:hypothetical protein
MTDDREHGRDTPIERAIDRIVEEMTRTNGVSMEASIARTAARVREPERVAYGWRVAWVGAVAVAVLIAITIAGVWRWMPRDGHEIGDRSREAAHRVPSPQPSSTQPSSTQTASTNVPTETVPSASITQPRARAARRDRARETVEEPFISDLLPRRDDLAVTTITPAPIEVPARLGVPLLDTPAIVVESIPVGPVAGPDAGPSPER